MSDPYLLVIAVSAIMLKVFPKEPPTITRKKAFMWVTIGGMMFISVLQLIYWLTQKGFAGEYYAYVLGSNDTPKFSDALIRHIAFLIAIVLQIKLRPLLGWRVMEATPNYSNGEKVSVSLFFLDAIVPVLKYLAALLVIGLIEKTFKLDFITDKMKIIALGIGVIIGVIGAIYGFYRTIRENSRLCGSWLSGVAITLFILFYYGVIIFSVVCNIREVILFWVAVGTMIFCSVVYGRAVWRRI